MTGPLNRQGRNTAQDLATIRARIEWITTHLPGAVSRLTDAQGRNDGYPASAGGSSSASSTATLTPVEAAAAARIAAGNRPDPATVDLRRINRMITQLDRVTDTLKATTSAYVRAPAPPEPKPCKKCGRRVTALRREMCPACHMRWLRNGSPTNPTPTP